MVQPNEGNHITSDSPQNKLIYITYMAKDLDETKNWYINKLGFVVIEDNTYDQFRWLVVGPAKDKDTAIAIVPAITEKQLQRVGSQSFLMSISDINSFYEQTQNNGVVYHGKPQANIGGSDAQFKDLYGNSWNVREHDKGFD